MWNKWGRGVQTLLWIHVCLEMLLFPYVARKRKEKGPWERYGVPWWLNSLVWNLQLELLKERRWVSHWLDSDLLDLTFNVCFNKEEPAMVVLQLIPPTAVSGLVVVTATGHVGPMPRSPLHTAGDPSCLVTGFSRHSSLKGFFPGFWGWCVCVCKAADSIKLRAAGNGSGKT